MGSSVNMTSNLVADTGLETLYSHLWLAFYFFIGLFLGEVVTINTIQIVNCIRMGVAPFGSVLKFLITERTQICSTFSSKCSVGSAFTLRAAQCRYCKWTPSVHITT